MTRFLDFQLNMVELIIMVMQCLRILQFAEGDGH